MENRAYALLAGVIYWFNQDRTLRTPYDIVSTGSVSGLNPKAAVRYRGILVGKVDGVRFDEKTPGQIVIRMKIDWTAPITSRTFASMGYQGLTGLAYINLDERKPDPVNPQNATLLASSDKDVARIPMQLGALEKLQARGEELLDQVTRLTEVSTQVLNKENRDATMTTLQSVRTAAGEFSQLIRTLEPAARKIPQLVTGADRTSVELQDLTSTLQQTAPSFNETVAPQLNGVGQDLRSASRSAARAFSLISNQPQSLIFGAPPPAAPRQ